MRTSLNAIIGYTEIVQDEVEDRGHDDLSDDLRRVARTSRHLLELVNNVLDLARMESGQLGMMLEPVEWRWLVDEVVEEHQDFARSNNTELTRRFDLAAGHVRSDPARLRQILDHLVENACKFTHDGKVEVVVDNVDALDGNWVVFRVFDSGPGMSNDEIARLFTPFSHGSEAVRRKFGGSGLGLAVADGLARLMGGRIEVSSTPGRGSTFSLWLPSVTRRRHEPEAEGQDELGAEPPTADTGANPGALLVFEDRALREMLIGEVTAVGFDVSVATGLHDAWPHLMRQRPSVVVADEHLADGTGFDLIAMMKQSEQVAKVPVVLVGRTVSAEQALVHGTADFLEYPPALRDVAATVKRYRVPPLEKELWVVEPDGELHPRLSDALERDGWNHRVIKNGFPLLAGEVELPGMIAYDVGTNTPRGFHVLTTLLADDKFLGIPVLVIASPPMPEKRYRILAGLADLVFVVGPQPADRIRAFRNGVADLQARFAAGLPSR